jgi:preprotein translocase subunit SecG
MPLHLNIGGVASTLFFAYVIILGWKVLERKKQKKKKAELCRSVSHGRVQNFSRQGIHQYLGDRTAQVQSLYFIS